MGSRGLDVARRIWVADSGRVFMGYNHESMKVDGDYQDDKFVAPGVVAAGPEGSYAQPSNSGRFVSNDFAVVPEGQVKVVYAMTPALQLTFGYDFLYQSRVVRPGDQLDRNLPKGKIFQQNGGAISSTSPKTLCNGTDLFGQEHSGGRSFGV